MKKLVTFLFFVAAITGQSWALTNVGIDVFGYAHTYFPVLSVSLDVLIPSASSPLSIGVYTGFGAVALSEDRNNPTTENSYTAAAMPLAVRLGWHFTTSSDKLDLYALLSGGYFFNLFTSYQWPYNSIGWPILEAGVGVRYMPLALDWRRFGVYAEAGFNPMPLIGQPLLSLWSIRIDMGIILYNVFDSR
jgi:hypothetical protein